MNLEQAIEHFSQLTPDKAAVIAGSETLSYSALWERIRQRAKRLREEGVADGIPYVFIATQDTDFITTYCAVHHCGGVCVPLERTTPEERQQKIREELKSQWSISGVKEIEEDSFDPQRSRFKGQRLNSKCSDILYTTGTTGQAKGVMVSAKAWTANADNLTDRLGFTSDLLFIVCGPLAHLGSLSKIYPTLMNGGTLYILESLKDLNAFFSVFELPFRKFATFLVPTSIRMLLQVASKNLAAVAPKIDFIETGAAAITQDDMQRLCRLLPSSRLFNTYASTETGIVCSYEFSKHSCVAGLLGKPMKHSSVRIDEEGRVVCSGDTIMSGYVGSPELTAQVLRDGEVITSDLGTLDEQGMLRLIGRQDDIINAGGFKVNPLEVEEAVSSSGLVSECICLPAPHVLLGTVPKLLYVPRQDIELKPGEIADYLRGRIESYKIPLLYEAVEAIRHTYNGKLDRKAYRKI